MELNFRHQGEAASSAPDKNRIYDSVARWAVYVAVALLPLFLLPWGTGILELNKQLLLVATAGIGLIAWLLGIVISGQVFLRLNAMDKGVAAILGATVVATVLSLVKYRSLFGTPLSSSGSLVTVAALSILYFLAVNVFEDRGRSLLTVLSVSLSATLAYGVLQLFEVYILPFAFSKSRAFNSVGPINALGILAAVSLPLFAKLTLRLRNFKYLDLSKLGLVLAMVVLAVINWWVLWAVAIAGMLAVIVAESFFTAPDRSKFILPMTVIVLAVFLMVVNFNLASVKKNLPVEVAPSQGLSTEITRGVLRDRLVFGYGPENFSLAFDRYGAGIIANTTLSGLRFFDSSSETFNIVVHGGILAVLALLFMLWTLVQTVIKYRHLHVADPEHSTAFIASLASVFGLGVALFLYPFNTTLIFLLYAVTAMLTLSVWGDQKSRWSIEEKPVVSLASSLGFIVGLILVLAGSYFVVLNYLADVSYARVSAESDINRATEQVVQAIGYNDRDERFYRTSSQLALKLLSAELSSRPEKEDPQKSARIQGYMTSSIDLARKATAVGPLESQNWANLGEIYGRLFGLVDGVDKLSEDAYLKAAELRPGDPSFYNSIGSMYLAKADLVRDLARSAGSNAGRFIQDYNASLQKSEEAFKKAIELAPSYGLAIYNLGSVYDRQGKVNEAIKELEKIIPYNANQPGLLFELGLLYYRAGRKDDAFAALQRAVLLSPQFANARWYLALIYEERNDLDSAIEQLRKILETNQDNAIVKTKLDQLETGRAKTPPDPVLNNPPL